MYSCPSNDLKNLMVKYPGSAITAPVEREACLDFCRSTPLCLAVDYDTLNLLCHRKYETALTAPWMWARWAEYNHYQRSCV
ncbi:hypothetical protein V1264_018156 [Littorina saxatilis]|uniref:Apple domain-containing protein n=1 Tax=Littorina saxatilis TaxID=31220 RepID=A0AAN9GBS7_9CAEN